MYPLIQSEVIWASDQDLLKGDPVTPPQMGKPKEGQLAGTPLEKLCELAGRICYDSLGHGRNSHDYHGHILQVNHLSVYEHGTFTVKVKLDSFAPEEIVGLLLALINRPHILVTPTEEGLEITLNLRHVLEFENKWDTNKGRIPTSRQFFAGLMEVARPLAPQILEHVKPKLTSDMGKPYAIELTYPSGVDQAHITCFLAGSRGWSHEQVRHRHAMSQRSSRFCNESESPWAWHPLLGGFQLDQPGAAMLDKTSERVRNSLRICEQLSKVAYEDTVDILERGLINAGVNNHTARKQARGAARGVLGNALYTEMLFTAPVSGWHSMLYHRCTVHADAEIRILFAELLPKLQKTSLGVWFNNLELEASPDGIGSVLTKDSMDMLAMQYHFDGK